MGLEVSGAPHRGRREWQASRGSRRAESDSWPAIGHQLSLPLHRRHSTPHYWHSVATAAHAPPWNTSPHLHQLGSPELHF